MKKTLLYILILGVLGAGVWYFLFNNNNNIFTAKDAGFTIKDTGAIGKIFLADNTNATVKLERTDNGWKVNDRYTALPSAVYMLLNTLHSQIPQGPVPEKMHNSVVRSLMGSSVKVEIYDKSGRKMRVFYVGGETNAYSGTNMLMEGGDKPYVVQIPGFEGYLTPRYIPDLSNWRDRTVFNIDSKNITKISVQYNFEPLNSFTITRTDTMVGVTIDPVLMEGKTLNQKRALSYLTFFKNVNSEHVANGLSGVREEISSVPKKCVMDVSGLNGYHQHADIYFMPMSKRSKNVDRITSDTTTKFDGDRMYAIINDEQDTVVIQTFVFDKFFRKGYEFYMNDL